MHNTVILDLTDEPSPPPPVSPTIDLTQDDTDEDDDPTQQAPPAARCDMSENKDDDDDDDRPQTQLHSLPPILSPDSTTENQVSVDDECQSPAPAAPRSTPAPTIPCNPQYSYLGKPFSHGLRHRRCASSFDSTQNHSTRVAGLTKPSLPKQVRPTTETQIQQPAVQMQPKPTTTDSSTQPGGSNKPQHLQQQHTTENNLQGGQRGRTTRSNAHPDGKWVDSRRQFWSSVVVTRGCCQSDPHGAGCIAQVHLTKGTTLVDMLCTYHPGAPPEPVDYASQVITARGSYVKTKEGYFNLIPSFTEWINEPSIGGQMIESKKANIAFASYYKDGTPVLALRIIRDIAIGEELLVLYNTSSKRVAEYTNEFFDLTESDDVDPDQTDANNNNSNNNDGPTMLELCNPAPSVVPKVEEGQDDYALLEQRRHFMTSIKLVSGLKQCDPHGAGVVAQRDINPGELFRDFFCKFNQGKLLERLKAGVSIQQRHAYIEMDSGYFVLDSCWSEWLNEARNQEPNMKFRIGMEESTPILEWYIICPIIAGQELLVDQYHKPIRGRSGDNVAKYVLRSALG